MQHIHNILQVQKHMPVRGYPKYCHSPLCPPDTPAPIPGPVTHPMGPQLAGWSSLVVTAEKQHSYTCLIGTPHLQVPQNQDGPLVFLSPQSGPKAQLASWSSLKMASKYKHPYPPPPLPMHRSFGEDRDTHFPPAAGTRHTG